jgi:dihydropteroate synthase
MLGASRKSFINGLYSSAPNERLVGSLATTMIAFQKKIDYIRVHDVKEHKQLIQSLEILS